MWFCGRVYWHFKRLNAFGTNVLLPKSQWMFRLKLNIFRDTKSMILRYLTYEILTLTFATLIYSAQTDQSDSILIWTKVLLPSIAIAKVKKKSMWFTPYRKLLWHLLDLFLVSNGTKYHHISFCVWICVGLFYFRICFCLLRIDFLSDKSCNWPQSISVQKCSYS